MGFYFLLPDDIIQVSTSRFQPTNWKCNFLECHGKKEGYMEAPH